MTHCFTKETGDIQKMNRFTSPIIRQCNYTLFLRHVDNSTKQNTEDKLKFNKISKHSPVLCPPA